LTTKLSLSDAWNDTAAFVKREWRLLFPVALLLNALPMAFATALLPDFAAEQAAGRTPEVGLWLLAIPVAAFVGIVGNVAICYLAISAGRSVGEGLRRGVSRFLPLFALYILVGIAMAILVLLVAVVASLLVPGFDPESPTPASLAGFVLLLVVVLLPVFLFVSTRLALAAPVAAAEEGGPMAILKRSLALTKPVFWTLLGFLILSSLLAGIVQMVATAVVGIPVLLIAGQGDVSQVILLIVGALVSAVVTLFVTTMVARIYVRLAGAPQADVFA
jgi:hypothetical protein